MTFMKYTDLIDPESLIPSESNYYKKYRVTRSFFPASSFIRFYPRRRQHCSYKEINTNWKAHLSIYPEDMNKAWKLIFPLLAHKDILFKVVNLNVIEKFKNGRQEKVKTLIEEYNQFVHNFNFQDIAFFKKKFDENYQQLEAYSYSKWRLISFLQKYLTQLTSFFYQSTLNRENLFLRTKNIYERLIDIKKQKLTTSLRFYEGMQFTIYMVPGLEKECQNTLEKIEDNLVRAKIRPGRIFPTDRQIGIYSSIRHPGERSYHKATDADLETYNPDNIDDPFTFLKTISQTEIMQEDDIQQILQNKASAQLIISALRTKQFISPLQLKTLAVYKEDVVMHIKNSHPEVSNELISDCFDKSSNLGKFFRIQRGMFKPKAGHGTLKQLEATRLTKK